MTKKQKILIISLITASILILIVIISCVREIIEQEKQAKITQEKQQAVKQYTDISDFKSIEEVLLYLDSEFISQEIVMGDNNTSSSLNKETSLTGNTAVGLKKEQLSVGNMAPGSNNEASNTHSESNHNSNVNIIVYAKLKYNLDLENKDFYNKLIEYSAQATNFKNFYIIDESQNISIYVQCNKANSISAYYINNEKFYFNNAESRKNTMEFTQIEPLVTNKTAPILYEIILKKWKANSINLGQKNSIYNGYDIYFDNGYNVKKVNGYIYNVVFTEKYKDAIVESLKVNSKQENIEKILGKPHFQALDCIGYKTQNFYIFFSKDQVSVYPVVTYNTDEIIKIIANNYTTNNITNYLNQIKKVWPDYDIYTATTNSAVLQYTLKGIAFKYDYSSKKGVTIYSNYSGKVDSTHNFAEYISNSTDLPYNMYFENEDLVFKEEENRLYSLDDYSSSNNTAIKPILNTSTQYKAYKNITTSRIHIVSINKTHPNSELKEFINYGIWYKDNILIYSVKGKGIFKYNADTREYETLIEGKDNYTIEKIEKNTLYYDDKTIDL